MTPDELDALAVTCPHLAAKARNPLQVELATILTTEEKEPSK
jgi:hypothetical protein